MMNTAALLKLETLQARLLSSPPPLKPVRSDFDLNPHVRPVEVRVLRASAVLVPIVARPEPTVLFTRRSIGLKRHAGQVSFPGGAADPTDASLTETALRELQEETGIDPSFVTVAGYSEVYETVTGFAVLPVVGILAEGFALDPDEREVDAVFEVPLAFLLDPVNCREESSVINGSPRRFYVFEYESHYIWGATAAMLRALSGRLR
jgi:8-oxo-dGTP pyrophosphatase MutT (NUDIX family)